MRQKERMCTALNSSEGGCREVRKTGQKAAGRGSGMCQRLKRLGLWVSTLSAWEVCCLPTQSRGLRRSSGWSGHTFKEGGPLPASQLLGQALDSEWTWHWSPLFGGGIIPCVEHLFCAQPLNNLLGFQQSLKEIPMLFHCTNEDIGI